MKPLLRDFQPRSAVAVLSALLLAGLAGCGEKPEPPAPAAPPAAAATNAAPALKPEFQRLLGKWLRPDGGYVLELKQVDADGKFEAGYFNPSPIHVQRAQGVRDSEGTRLVVELRDENYPGCIYKLTYDEKNDQLFGTYYQAAMNQTYDIAFGRYKE
jgi:hypothetical protein